MSEKYTNDIPIMKGLTCLSLLGFSLSIYTKNNAGIVLNGIGLYTGFKYFESLMYIRLYYNLYKKIDRIEQHLNDIEPHLNREQRVSTPPPQYLDE